MCVCFVCFLHCKLHFLNLSAWTCRELRYKKEDKERGSEMNRKRKVDNSKNTSAVFVLYL